MKQGILVTAYKNANQLLDIIHSLNDDYKFYIHIDKKSGITQSSIQQISTAPNVEILSQKYIVNWGGLNHLKAILFLSEQVLKDDTIEYIHLISGQDYPTKTSAEIADFLKANKGKQFLQFDAPPNQQEMDRIMKYNFFDFFNGKTNRGANVIFWISLILKKLKLTRKEPKELKDLYVGSTWWTLSRDCLKYVLNFTREHPSFLKRFRYTFCSEEFYFQSVIMNSPFKDDVINNNLRYIVWEPRGNSLPAILDETDFAKIRDSKAIFARKIEYPASNKLLSQLKQHKAHTTTL